MNLENIDWIIVGGESGHHPRPINEDWVLNIMDQCKIANKAFFLKQWGGTNKKKAGRLINGQSHDEMPVSIIQL